LGKHKACYFQNDHLGLSSEDLLHQCSPPRALHSSPLDAQKGQTGFLTRPLYCYIFLTYSDFCHKGNLSHNLPRTAAEVGYLCGWRSSRVTPQWAGSCSCHTLSEKE